MRSNGDLAGEAEVRENANDRAGCAHHHQDPVRHHLLSRRAAARAIREVQADVIARRGARSGWRRRARGSYHRCRIVPPVTNAGGAGRMAARKAANPEVPPVPVDPDQVGVSESKIESLLKGI